MTRFEPARCCGKTSYATEQVALAALRHIAFIATGRHPIAAYRCPNGWVHLTSHPRRTERTA